MRDFIENQIEVERQTIARLCMELAIADTNRCAFIMEAILYFKLRKRAWMCHLEEEYTTHTMPLETGGILVDTINQTLFGYGELRLRATQTVTDEIRGQKCVK